MDRETANELSRFQSFDLVQRAFHAKHGLELNAERTHEIISSFIQAKGYLDSAATAAEAVRPLLLYYGVLSMSRGTILFLEPSKREDTLKPSHGLDTEHWRQVLSPGTQHVLDLEVAVGNGTFSELVEATGNSMTVVTPNADGGATWSWSPRPLGMTSDNRIRFDDILSRIDALSMTYRDVTGAKSKCYLGSWLDTQDALAVSVVMDPLFGLMDADEVRRVMLVPDDVRISASPGSGMPCLVYRLGYRADRQGALVTPAYEDPDGLHGDRARLVAPWPNGGYISPLLRSFLASYFLGMLVRYYPSRWMSLIRNLKGDAALPLLRAVADHVERDFPVQILVALS